MTWRLALRWWGHDLRRRPWRLMAVAAFVAFGVGMLAAAVDGARRSSTSVDRAIAAVRPADGIVVPNEPGFDWAPVAALDAVDDLVTFPVLYFEVVGWEGTWGGFPPGRPDAGTTWERPVVVAGRLADPMRADEVTISPSVHAGGVDVGDRLTIRLFSMSEAFSGSTDPKRRDVPVTVVGVTKLSFFSADVQPTHALFAEHEDLVVGEHGYVNAIVRLRPGADLADFERDVSAIAGRAVEVLRTEELLRGSREAVALETAGLVALALAGLVAVLLLVGQALARMTGANRLELDLLRQLGLRRRAAEAIVLASPASALVLGSALAPFVAWLASSGFPIGIGRDMEPAPGRRVDWLVVGGTVVLVGAVLFATLLVASRAMTRRGSGPPELADAAGEVVRRLPISVPAMLGARLALSRRPDGSPARAVTWIVATGVVGIVAAVTFGAALGDAIDDPEVFGQGYDAGVLLLGQEVDAADFDVLEPERVTHLVNVVAPVDGQPVSVVGARDIVGTFSPVILRGRVPAGEDEVGMSPLSMEILGVDLGDNVDVAGRDVTVVAEVLSPELGHTSYTSGLVVAEDLLDHVLANDAEVKFELIAVDLPPDTDLARAKALLSDDLAFAIEPWIPPQRQDDLGPTRPLPTVFAGFVALLVAGSVGHALAATARQRHHEVAVLQVLGATRSQARRTVLWHGVIAAIAGCLVGVPVGIVLGRTLWRGVANSLPALHRAPGAWPGAVIVVAAVVAAGVVLATWSAQRTARTEPALVLRTE